MVPPSRIELESLDYESSVKPHHSGGIVWHRLLHFVHRNETESPQKASFTGARQHLESLFHDIPYKAIVDEKNENKCKYSTEEENICERKYDEYKLSQRWSFLEFRSVALEERDNELSHNTSASYTEFETNLIHGNSAKN